MKKRLLKKIIKKISDTELCEHVAYTENKRLRALVEKEFDNRFGEAMKKEEMMAEELMVISKETDELMDLF